MKFLGLSLCLIFYQLRFSASASETADAPKGKTRTVSTLLNAKWNSTPTALEIAEFMNDEDPSYFWSFLEDISRNTDDFSKKTDKGKYEALVDLSRKYLSEAQVSLMKFSLALHVYSPKIEMFQQIAMVQGVPEQKCEAVAEVNGKLTCDSSLIKSLLNEKPKSPELYKLDHQYPGKVAKNRPVVILYGEIGSKKLTDFHNTLKPLSELGEIIYVIRHYISDCKGPKVRLSGYGVELQIKSTEYKAQDDTKVTAEQSGAPGDEGASQQVEDENVDIEGFLFSKLKVLNPDLAPKLDKLKQSLLDESQELAPLKVWQLQELSLQAAERILSAAKEESLKIMAQLAQNFPLLARSIVRTTVRPALKAEIKRNQQRFANDLSLQPSDAALFINGQHFNVDSMDVFTLFEQLREEVKLVEGLHKIGVPSQYVSSILSLDLSPASRQYAVDIRDSAVLFVNDIEKDPQYKRWSPNIQDLLRPNYPGALRSIRRNMYNLVLVVDPLLHEARSLIKLAESFVVHNAPLRVGLVMAVSSDPKLPGRDDAGVAMLNAFNYVAQRTHPTDGLSFITDLFAVVGENSITVDDIGKLLKKKFSADLEDVLGEDSDYDVGRQLTKDFLRRTGFRKLPQVLLNGVALDENSLNADEFEEAVLTELMRQTSSLQKALFRGELKEEDNVIDFLMGQPNVMPRLNDRVLSTSAKYLDMTGVVESGINDLTSLSSHQLIAAFADSITYVSSNTKALTPITLWLVTDVTQPAGRQLVQNALEYVENSRLIRLSLLHNPQSLSDSPSHYIEAIDAALSSNDIKLLSKLLKTENAEAIVLGTKTASDFGVEPTQKSSFGLKLHHLLAGRVLEFQPGQRGLIVNGRVIGPFDEEEDFTSDDVALLEKHTMSTSGEKILQFLQDLPQLHSSDLIMKVGGLLMSSAAGSTPKTRHNIDELGSELSLLHFPPKLSDSPFIDITAVVDPLSVGAQKLAPLLLVLQEVLNCRVRVFMNCVDKNSEMPLKSFYRLVLEPDLMFGADERQLSGPIAKFGILPMGALLTQGMQVPDNWLVESVWSPYDLDNIRLRDVDTDVHSEYELEHLILEGHCFDSHSGSPPRGLQLTLGTPVDPLMVDTIVMANLGYLQLKANPGSWILRLREGRSTEIYDIVSHEGTDTPSSGGSGDIHVLIGSFKSHVLKLKVAKKTGKQQMDLLSSDDDDNNAGLWNSITSTFTSKSSDDDEDKLNIFSLASGHLYERFIRIMMVSVLKHTKTPVKFWFLKQYLSPTLKDFLPHMAAQYGFEYELVQYKWPRWLHQQKEKQRIIWGYKILFLDVLFPLSVKKIIFVDADQIVRADLKELRDLDLGGAPYGYTPFCDSRREMDGFRFWKSGYWRNHLQGRKYHISALYVVDLKRFRKIAAGDRLRGQYQALSQDPNSLSNLDQDLPNNMIHQVPIKSLPQEWLWCETWCDDTSKQKAKTIDLCNNPQTKEAKLDAAVRIVAEWNDYDSEIKMIQEELARNRTEQQRQHDPSEF